MAVEFMKQNPVGFLDALGVAKTLQDYVTAGKIVVHVGHAGFKLVGQDNLSGFSISGVMSPKSIQLLLDSGKSGKPVSFIGKAQARYKFEMALVSLLHKANVAVAYVPMKAPEHAMMVGEDAGQPEQPPLVPSDPEPSPDAVEKVNSVLIPLRDATEIYKRVKTSSASKAYVSVAISPDLNLAVRVVGSDLSARAESPTGNLGAYSDVLTGLGFTVKSHYASIHLECTAQATAEKIIGALIVGLKVPFKTAIPCVEIVRALSI